MKNLKKLRILIAMLIFFASCEKINISQNDGLIDEGETRLMEECRANPFSSKSEVEAHFIGEWELIGHGNSVFGDEPEPDINLTISDEHIIIEYSDEYEEKVDTASWEIKEMNSPAGQSFWLETTPTISTLPIQYFCEDYMYGQTFSINATIGRMYLYKKR